MEEEQNTSTVRVDSSAKADSIGKDAYNEGAVFFRVHGLEEEDWGDALLHTGWRSIVLPSGHPKHCKADVPVKFKKARQPSPSLQILMEALEKSKYFRFGDDGGPWPKRKTVKTTTEYLVAHPRDRISSPILYAANEKNYLFNETGDERAFFLILGRSTWRLNVITSSEPSNTPARDHRMIQSAICTGLGDHLLLDMRALNPESGTPKSEVPRNTTFIVPPNVIAAIPEATIFKFSQNSGNFDSFFKMVAIGNTEDKWTMSKENHPGFLPVIIPHVTDPEDVFGKDMTSEERGHYDSLARLNAEHFLEKNWMRNERTVKRAPEIGFVFMSSSSLMDGENSHNGDSRNPENSTSRDESESEKSNNRLSDEEMDDV